MSNLDFGANQMPPEMVEKILATEPTISHEEAALRLKRAARELAGSYAGTVYTDKGRTCGRLSINTSWVYDDLARMARELGTSKISFTPGADTSACYYPGDVPGGDVEIEVTW